MIIMNFTAIPSLTQPIVVGKWQEQKLFWTDRHERLYVCTNHVWHHISIALALNQSLSGIRGQNTFLHMIEMALGDKESLNSQIMCFYNLQQTLASQC
jgi:hypothetical protein